MPTDDQQSKLATLGFSQQWLDYGLLTPDQLALWHATLETSDDQHTEHYRYGAFRNYLNDHIRLTDDEVVNYLQVALTDADALMGVAAAKDLFTEIQLTDKQFLQVCQRIDELPGDWTGQLIVRQQLMRQIEKSGLTAALFMECLEKGDSVVQKMLVELADMPQLRSLASTGVTKAVRNLAQEKLRCFSSQFPGNQANASNS